MNSGGDRRLEAAMGRMLQIGVTVAASVVFVGGVLYLRQFRGQIPDYRKFHGAPAAYESVSAIFAGACRIDSASLIAFGILLLIATPICRVLFGLIGFSLLRDRFYAAVSTIVLMILLLSFFLKR